MEYECGKIEYVFTVSIGLTSFGVINFGPIKIGMFSLMALVAAVWSLRCNYGGRTDGWQGKKAQICRKI